MEVLLARTPQFTVLHSCYYMEYSHMGRRESGCFVKINRLCFSEVGWLT